METNNIVISSDQAVMARAVLRWSLPQVRERTGFSVTTVHGFEKGRGVQIATMCKLRDLYASQGVKFFPDGKTVAFDPKIEGEKAS